MPQGSLLQANMGLVLTRCLISSHVQGQQLQTLTRKLIEIKSALSRTQAQQCWTVPSAAMAVATDLSNPGQFITNCDPWPCQAPQHTQTPVPFMCGQGPTASTGTRTVDDSHMHGLLQTP
jgi:hypothetical protein